MTSASHIIDSLKLQDEEKAVKQLLAENSWTADQRALIQERAITLALAIRGHTPPSWVDKLMAAYDLGGESGRLLMSLAECILRIPDPATAHAFLEDKLTQPGISALLSSKNTWVSSLMGNGLQIAKLLVDPDHHPFGLKALGSAKKRVALPLVHKAVTTGMTLLAKKFIFAPTIHEAMSQMRQK